MFIGTEPWPHELTDESAVTAIEYALLGALVSVGAIIGFQSFGTALNALYEDWIVKALAAINSFL